VTGHKDASVRLWSENGTFLVELVSQFGVMTGAEITSIGSSSNGKYLITGDSRGQLAIWLLDKYFINDLKPELIIMLANWRGHQTPVIDIAYSSINNLIFTASIDESVRAFWGIRGHYVGFLSQKKLFVIPDNEMGLWAKPYDINEVFIASFLLLFLFYK
jgi:WD repeat-containing protein 64